MPPPACLQRYGSKGLGGPSAFLLCSLLNGRQPLLTGSQQACTRQLLCVVPGVQVSGLLVTVEQGSIRAQCASSDCSMSGSVELHNRCAAMRQDC
jgi:hypothetical protein